MPYMTRDQFQQKIREGEALGIDRATIYKSMKSKGYEIEGDPSNTPSMKNGGGVFGYFGDVVKNAVREVGGLAKFAGEVVTDPRKGVEFGRDMLKGVGTLAVGAGENIFEAVTGKDVPTFNPDGTVTYSQEGTQEQQVASQFGQSAVEAVTNPLDTFREHPLATLSVAAPMGAGALGRASTLAKAEGLTRTAQALGTAGRAVGYADPIRGTIKAAEVLPPIAGRAATGLAGKMTGAGGEAVRIAAAPKKTGAFVEGMRGDVLEQGSILLDDTNRAMKILKDKRAQQYLKTQEGLQAITEPMNPRPIRTMFQKIKEDFNILMQEEDLLRQMVGMTDEQAQQALIQMTTGETSVLSPLVKAGIGDGVTASKMSKAIHYIDNWDDFTPDGLDRLQKSLSSLDPKAGSIESAFITKAKKGVQNVVKEKYPEYAKMLEDYSEASDIIESMQKAILGADRKSVEQNVLKLSQTMKTGNLKFEIKNALLQQLEEVTGVQLRERVAGMALAEAVPRGLAGVGAGIGGIAVIGQVIAPSFLMGLAASSPRVVGEVLNLLGIARSKIPSVTRNLKTALPVEQSLRSSTLPKRTSVQQQPQGTRGLTQELSSPSTLPDTPPPVKMVDDVTDANPLALPRESGAAALQSPPVSGTMGDMTKTKLYHGTSSKIDGELKFPLYTIDNVDTAKSYATSNNNLTGRARGGDAAKVIEFEMNPSARVFDLRNPAHRELLKNNKTLASKVKLDFDGYPFASQNGMADFFVTEDIAKIIKDKKLPFDAIAFDDRGGRGAGLVALNKNALLQKSSPPSLLAEARKYKSAEEFVKAQGTPVYHGTTRDFDVFDKAKLGEATRARSAKEGFWFTDDVKTAKSYAIAENWKKVQDFIDAGDTKAAKALEDAIFADKAPSKIVDASVKLKKPLTIDAGGQTYGDFAEEIEKAIAKAKKAGNDGVIFKNLSDTGDYSDYRPATHYLIFDENALKTKSQLTDLWKQANQSKP